jgi:hypothetical protein
MCARRVVQRPVNVLGLKAITVSPKARARRCLGEGRPKQFAIDQLTKLFLNQGRQNAREDATKIVHQVYKQK